MRWTDRAGERIRLRDLHILLVVIEHGSMTQAARELSVFDTGHLKNDS